VRGDIKAFGNDPDIVPWLNAKHGFGGWLVASAAPSRGSAAGLSLG